MAINKLRREMIVALVLAAGACLPAMGQTPLSTAFNYQGNLVNSGSVAQGAYDMRFRLYDMAAAGSQIGTEICFNDVQVVNGGFSVPLDFGAVFTGQSRYLEIEVRSDTGLDCGDVSGYTLLQPRQEMSATPHAIYSIASGNAATLNGQFGAYYTNAANLTGTVNDARLSTNMARLDAAQTFSGTMTFTNALNTFNGSGAGLTTLNAASLSSGTVPDVRISAAFPRLAAANNFTAANNFAGNVGIGTTAPTAGCRLDVVGGNLRVAQNTNPYITLTRGAAANNLDIGAASAPGNFSSSANPDDVVFRNMVAGKAIHLQSGQGAAGLSIMGNNNVGIGTTSATSRLTVDDGASSAPLLLSGNWTGGTWSEIRNTTSGKVWQFVASGSANGNGTLHFGVGSTSRVSERYVMSMAASGNVGIGNSNPSEKLHLSGSMKIDGSNTLEFGAGVAGKHVDAGKIGYGNWNTNALNIVGAGTAADNRRVYVWAEGGTTFTGRVSATTVEIRGGADITEGFDSQTSEIEPGTLMVIDPAHPGQLMPSASAYDSKVAGIVSGAGGVVPGIKMGQDSVMNGKHAVAMTGRVYVKCSTSNGPIKAGDLLTTSDLPGHAMKAIDRTLAPGATVGKAMSTLDSGEGLVLVLVNLQ